MTKKERNRRLKVLQVSLGKLSRTQYTLIDKWLTLFSRVQESKELTSYQDFRISNDSNELLNLLRETNVKIENVCYKLGRDFLTSEEQLKNVRSQLVT